LAVLAACAKLWPGVDIFPVSARTGKGRDRLEAAILAMVPEGPPLFPVQPDVDLRPLGRHMYGNGRQLGDLLSSDFISCVLFRFDVAFGRQWLNRK